MTSLRRKTLDIPAMVSGRRVTNRGVHLQPFGYHGKWLDQELEDGYWTGLLKDMGMSWVVILTEGDSVLEERGGLSPLKALLDAGIIPIIRDKQKLPHGFFNVETVKRTVALYARYGLRPFWQLYNEPFDNREWEGGHVPAYDKAWNIIATRWSSGARQVADAGAYVGFPDGPGYGENPFERLRPAGGLDVFDEGVAFYAPHNYGLGRPLWYPYDAVSRHAAQLTEQAYRRLLDDFAEHPHWYDAPLEMINQQRLEWSDPLRTAKTDDTCWRGWEKIVQWAIDSLGYVPPMAMTEGGWTPRARAGGNPVDNRWSYATPKVVARKTLQMYDTPSPFFAICPWLLATDDMGGVGWYDDAWHGGAFSDKYGVQKPVITILKASRPKEVAPRTEPMVLDLNGDTRDWQWVQRTHGAIYRRAVAPEPPQASEDPLPPAIRLIEVHEYEGPGTLDVIMVDGDGLPLEGIEFYHHYPGAPAIGGDEWHGQAARQVTNAEGRTSFPSQVAPGAPGQGVEAIWPRGKGDILEKLGLLAGTPNRHLNAVWQLVEGGSFPTDESSGPGEGPGEAPDEGSVGNINEGPGENINEGPGENIEEGPGENIGEGPGESAEGWQMTVEYRPGARIIAGSLPREGIAVTVSDPWGNASTVSSGSKLEHGPGGFEVLAPNATIYTLTFLDQRFEVQTHEGATFVTLREAEPGTGEGPGEGPGEEPGEEPGEGTSNKLGFYIEASTTPGLADAIRAVQPPTILTHANDRGLLQAIRRELAPDSFIVGRLHFTPAQQDTWLNSGDPEGAARALADMILELEMVRERGSNGRLLVDAWMSLNECLPGPASKAWKEGTPEEQQAIRRRANAYDRFMVAFRQRLKEVDAELEAVAFNFGAGNFPDAAGYLEWFPATLSHYRYLGFHEYGWPALSPHLDPQAASSAASYRQAMTGIRQKLGPHHRVIITEAGLARMYKYPAAEAGDVGWLYPGETISQANYWQSLVWYNGVLSQDDYVLGACLFEVGHSGQWETFRHLGVDNAGNPLQIIPWIQGLQPRDLEPGPRALPVTAASRETGRPLALRGQILSRGQPVGGALVHLIGTPEALAADPDAAAYLPSAVEWSRTISGFQGSLWNCWQRFVGRSVAGITWEEFKAQAAGYNPSLHESDDRFVADRTYRLPENPPGVRPGIVWDRKVRGFSGDRWACWKQYVQGKVVGLTWPEFRQQVLAHNPELAQHGTYFVPSRSYRLPRSVGQEWYKRVSLSDAPGWYHFEGLRHGRYDLVVVAEGYQPLRQEIEVDPATRCYLELDPVG